MRTLTFIIILLLAFNATSENKNIQKLQIKKINKIEKIEKIEKTEKEKQEKEKIYKTREEEFEAKRNVTAALSMIPYAGWVIQPFTTPKDTEFGVFSINIVTYLSSFSAAEALGINQNYFSLLSYPLASGLVYLYINIKKDRYINEENLKSG